MAKIKISELQDRAEAEVRMAHGDSKNIENLVREDRAMNLRYGYDRRIQDWVWTCQSKCTCPHCDDESRPKEILRQLIGQTVKAGMKVVKDGADWLVVGLMFDEDPKYNHPHVGTIITEEGAMDIYQIVLAPAELFEFDI